MPAACVPESFGISSIAMAVSTTFFICSSPSYISRRFFEISRASLSVILRAFGIALAISFSSWKLRPMTFETLRTAFFALSVLNVMI